MLRDTDEIKKYSDGEILDKLAQVELDLIAEFRENIKKISLDCSEILELPAKIAYLHKATLNKAQDIPLKSATQAFKSSEICLYHLNNNQYALNKEISGKLEIIASFYNDYLRNKETPLALDSSYNQALALGSTAKLMLSETHPQTLQKQQFYKQEYAHELSRLRSLKNRAKGRSYYETKSQEYI
ncbi:MAG: hypothetical protein PUB96_08645 [Helicobacteraceae bacterium]|nr:hypothetical protein [Helicobacteraceae bacterium]